MLGFMGIFLVLALVCGISVVLGKDRLVLGRDLSIWMTWTAGWALVAAFYCLCGWRYCRLQARGMKPGTGDAALFAMAKGLAVAIFILLGFVLAVTAYS